MLDTSLQDTIDKTTREVDVLADHIDVLPDLFSGLLEANLAGPDGSLRSVS